MNHKNPAIKRILADVKELQKHPSSRYHAVPLEENMFEWHFTIRGPVDTPFSEGMYHGRIILPAEYPFKPPNIVFMTKNGRFEVGTKICLSISAYHEETWQPAWGVRTMLEALISFLPSEAAGAIGALDWTAEERKKLALESHAFCCPICGPISSLLSASTADEKPDQEMQAQIGQLHMTRARNKSERIDPRNLVNDMALGADVGMEEIPDAGDVDTYEGVVNIDIDGDGVADIFDRGVDAPMQDIDHPLAHMQGSIDADDGAEHNLDIHDPLEEHPANPRGVATAAERGPFPSSGSPVGQDLRHRRPLPHQPPTQALPAQAPPAPRPYVPANGPVIQIAHAREPIAMPIDDPILPRQPLWGRDEDREPWRRFMDKLLDVFILATMLAIMVVSFRILSRLARENP